MSDEKINIEGIDKAELLMALVNAARPAGLGYLQATGLLTKEEAQKWIEQRRSHDGGWPSGALCFDYVCGRPIKCDLSGTDLDPYLYDRDQGEGSAAKVVAALRAAQQK